MLQGLLTTASKAPGGGYAYNTASVPLLAEALKLAVSAWLLERQRRTAPELARTTRSLRGAALFCGAQPHLLAAQQCAGAPPGTGWCVGPCSTNPKPQTPRAYSGVMLL